LREKNPLFYVAAGNEPRPPADRSAGFVRHANKLFIFASTSAGVINMHALR